MLEKVKAAYLKEMAHHELAPSDEEPKCIEVSTPVDVWRVGSCYFVVTQERVHTLVDNRWG